MGLRSLIGQIVGIPLRAAGYDVVKRRASEFQFDHYSPWMSGGDARYDEVFQKANAIANWVPGRSDAVPMMRERMYVPYWAARNALRLNGDFVECGVYRGGSATICAEATRGAVEGRRFYLFDTFSGTPKANLEESEADFEHQRADTNVDVVRERLAEYGDFPVIVQGKVPDTFAELPEFPVAYLHIDINTAFATSASLEFFYERLVEGAVVVLDDYGWEAFSAQRQQVNAFAAARGALVLPLRCGSGILVKA
ncbi:MAG TPA: TylF/MycF/NovP-related O-methyltransferase [Pyrinomonadaceae bacterium]